MSDRAKYATRSLLLRNESIRESALAVIRNAPLDDAHPVQVVVREEVKARKADQNALMWTGPLADIAEQAYVKGRTFAVEVWHEFFKREFLPEEFDPEQCREGYRKWDYMPNGDRTLIGSTTGLTVRGFAHYLTQVEAHGASLGVRYHANPKDARWAA